MADVKPCDELELCKDNTMCCDEDCVRCINNLYRKYLSLKDELEFTREFIHRYNLEWCLLSERSKRNV